jgi:F0F1-type ATP synthase epsilon subunit
VVCSEDVEMVTLPGIEGQMETQPQHVCLIAQLVPRERVQKDGSDNLFAAGDELVEINHDRTAIVTGMAIASDKMDKAKRKRRGSANGSRPRKSHPSMPRWPARLRDCH